MPEALFELGCWHGIPSPTDRSATRDGDIMSTATTVTTSTDTRPWTEAPVYPSTSAEFINVFAHYHRAEIARMAGWRDRIDRTTNWAITVVAAMLSVSLSTPTAHH